MKLKGLLKKKEKAETNPQPKQKKKRSKLGNIIRFFIAALFILAVVACAAIFIYWQYTKTHYEISFYQITSKKVSRNIRFVVISDIHNREYGEGNELLISDIRSLKPDIILFAGDMVLKEQDDYQPMLNLVSNLAEIAPCYGVLGNHESERYFYAEDKDLPKKFQEAGLKVLRNAQEMITIGVDTIQLIGVEGTAYGFEAYNGRKFMDNTSINPSALCVLMSHVPILFDSQLTDYSFDLGIAGHVHGGLVILPYFGGLYSDEEGFLPTYYAGKQTLSNDATLIISRGLGDSKNIPRINNMPELVVIDVNWY